MYQFIAKDVAPPFTFFLPHPRKPLPLPEVGDKPATLYNNHLLLVECSEGRNLMELDLLNDDYPPSINSSSSRTCISEGK
jgi:hypothetical protein